MTSRSLVFWLAISLVFSGWGARAKDAPRVATKHCLWRAQGASNTVYLLGSVHLLKKEMYPLDPPLEEAYRQAASVAFEADFEEMESPKFMAKMMREGMYPAGDSLTNHLSKELYSLLRSNLQESVGAGNAFDGYKPWMAAVGLMGVELQKLGYTETNGVDKHFFERAQADHKRVLALETLDFQLSLFAGLTGTESESFLAETLKELATMKKEFAELIEAWRTGDTAALEKILLEQFREYPALQKKLLLERNARWAPQIEKMLQGEKNALVIVGAAHLIGRGSVVELLREKGFKVEQR